MNGGTTNEEVLYQSNRAGTLSNHTYVGTETVSWMCILGAAPFAALGFIKYNGMTAEKFVWAWFKSEFLMPKKLTFRSTNTYYEMMKLGMEHKQKEVSKAND